ncbi:hypothetical protein FOMPIDRAFT_18855, partial [Fomitopsis schrenkii]
LVQLRTEHAPLNYYLHRIDRAESPTCPACAHARETVTHYLLDCPKYGNTRARLQRKIGSAAHTLRYLLAEPGTLKPLFQFIHETRRFAATYGDL